MVYAVMVSTCQDCQDEVRIFGDLQFLSGLSGCKRIKVKSQDIFAFIFECVKMVLGYFGECLNKIVDKFLHSVAFFKGWKFEIFFNHGEDVLTKHLFENIACGCQYISPFLSGFCQDFQDMRYPSGMQWTLFLGLGVTLSFFR